jgi:hypothetical protein
MAPTLGNGSVWRSVDRRTRSVAANHHVPLKPAWSPCSVSPSPNDGSARLLGQHLEGGSGAAILVGQPARLEPTHDHDPAAPAQRLDGMLGLVAPHDHGVERRLLLPPTRHGHPEHRPGRSRLGLDVADLGSSGGCRPSSRWPRSWCCPPVAWPGGLPVLVERRTGGCRGMVHRRAGAVPLAPTLPLGAGGSLGCGVVSFIPAFCGQLDSVFLAGACVNMLELGRR